MSRFYFVVLSIAILSFESQAQWNRINPKPTDVPLNGIWFVDSLNVWAVGSGGIVLHSVDGGESWIERTLMPQGELQKITFTGPLHGIIVGGDISAVNGALFVTTDGGETWVDKHPNTTYRYAYFDLYFVSATRGWIAGFEGIFSTIDGGQSWTRSTSNGLGWNTSVFFIDSLVGWCTNPVGGIMKSTDGGITWLSQASLGWRWFKRIRFATPSTGWAVGGGLYETKGTIFRTTTGGTTWVIQDSVEGYEYHDIHVIDSLHAWVVGDRGTVRYTTDGGSIWFAGWTNNTDTYTDVTFRGTQCWIVGGSYSYPVILTTLNGGNPAVMKSSHFTLANITAVQFISDTAGWLAVDDGTLFKSTNGGTNWQPLNLFTVPWRSMAAPDHNTLFVGGDNGTLIRTTDAGRTWTLSTITGVESISQMKFVTSKTGWILGGSHFGNLYKTTDSGVTWLQLNISGSKFEFVDEQNGWLIETSITSSTASERTQLLHTTDGGTIWSTLPSNSLINDLAFSSPMNGWMSAEYDSLLHTTDGGVTWQLLNLLGDRGYEIKFVTENEGWVRGTQTLFHTTDGGVSFTPEYGTIMRVPHPTLYFYSSTLGFIFGTSGGLLRYSTSTTGAKEHPVFVALPLESSLYQNYPNPFNPVTVISYQLAVNSFVTVKVFDLLGREVATLVNETKPAGTYTVRWDAAKNSSGVYFYQLRAIQKDGRQTATHLSSGHIGDFVETKKMLLMK